MNKDRSVKFYVSEKAGEVSGILNLPGHAKALYLFAHGAGAPMNHPFMNKAADLLAEHGIGTLRYNFPYTEKGSKRIDPLPVLLETVKASVSAAHKYSKGIPLFAGGKSMGGRMTSQAMAKEALDGVAGLIFYGFPLHAPGKDSIERAEHLYKVNVPMLFLQGTRDKLANLDLLKPIIAKIGKNASLFVAEGADHSFHVLKSSGRTDDEVLNDLTGKVENWISGLIEE